MGGYPVCAPYAFDKQIGGSAPCNDPQHALAQVVIDWISWDCRQTESNTAIG